MGVILDIQSPKVIKLFIATISNNKKFVLFTLIYSFFPGFQLIHYPGQNHL